MTPLWIAALALVIINATSAALFARAIYLHRDWWRVAYVIGLLANLWVVSVYVPVLLGWEKSLPFELARSVAFALSVVSCGFSVFVQLRRGSGK